MQPIPTQPVPQSDMPVDPMAPQAGMPAPPMAPQPGMPAPPIAPVAPVAPMGVQPGMPAPPVAPQAQYAPPAAAPAVNPSAAFETHLRVLESVGGLFIKQKAEAFEAMTGYETCNKYKVYLTGPDCVRGKDQEAYYKAKEESECFQRQCCGNMRAFEMKIYGPDKQIFIVLKRPFKCSCCCCNLPELHIEDANGNKVGKVMNIFDCCNDRFTIYDHNDMPIMTIHGDCCQWGKVCTMPMGPCAEVRFDILNTTTNSVGFIKKIFSGFVKEAFTDADSFVLSFPPDATVQQKMLLLGSVFLLDFMYFESNQSNDNQHNIDFD